MTNKNRNNGLTEIGGMASLPENVRAWYVRQSILSRILKSVLNETDHRIDLIVEMVQDHGDMVIHEARSDVDSRYPESWDLSAFLTGAKMAVIKRLEGRISDAMTLALGDLMLDASRFGTVASYGRCNAVVAELFMDMICDGVDEDRIAELVDHDITLYGGHEDEPDDDGVDLDNLIEGLAVMMEGHGVRGDVRAKAKEFLAAVATDTLNMVISDE